MTANELRQKYIEFFREKGHAFIPSASLVPENDPSVLFTTAGMHPLVPFLLGEPHPAGTRLVNYQRCIRTGDIESVGDDMHLTFFEMLGNWSLGDYFKPEAIEWSWEFLTSQRWLGLPPEKISVSVFAGDADAQRDYDSANLWDEMGVTKERIYYYGKKDNWWGPAGPTGPCGPDTEMFFDTGRPCSRGRGFACEPNCGCGRFVEIWNDVFMEYDKTADGKYLPLEQRNVDTGMGLERTLQVLNGLANVYETEVFKPIIDYIRQEAKRYEERSARIIADHLKAAVFMIADGVTPSNKEHGYVLRRLLRKADRESVKIGFDGSPRDEIYQAIIQQYGNTYSFLPKKQATIVDEINKETIRFAHTLVQGNKYLEKTLPKIKENFELAGETAFDLHQTNGFPPEMTYEILTQEKGIPIDRQDFLNQYRACFSKHQDVSRQGLLKKFSGGLADHSERVVRMHTATHLLHRALRDVLGPHVCQKGSNITEERLRFDFTHPQKMTPEELKRVEEIVNEKIQTGLPVTKKVIPLEEARTLGAIGLFGEKYSETVSVYLIGDYSKEFCGGPHVANTREIGQFRILKEEASSAGVRRIRARVT